MGFSIKEGYNSISNSMKSAAEGMISDLNKATSAPRQQSINTTRKTFDANKYKIDQLSYPIDLMSPQYGGNYAVFYINVADDSRLNVKENTVELDPTTEARMRNGLVAKNLSVAGLAAASGGLQVLESLKGGMQKDKDGKNSGKLTAAKAGIEGSVNAIGVAVAGSLAPNASRSQRRLKTAIALHVPNQLSVRYGTTWDVTDTAAIQAVADAGGALAEAISDPANMKKALASGGSVVREAAANLALTKLPNAGAISAALGIAANPKKEQTFQGVEFRKFSFDYQFFPRDEFEAENVLNIIHQFKLHMHPEFKSELNYVWIYPSEFDITYYTQGSENLNLHRHTSCVLKNMNVNYTPNGSFSVFANGMPTQINVTLEFKELQLASKETIGNTPGGL